MAQTNTPINTQNTTNTYMAPRGPRPTMLSTPGAHRKSEFMARSFVPRGDNASRPSTPGGFRTPSTTTGPRANVRPEKPFARRFEKPEFNQYMIARKFVSRTNAGGRIRRLSITLAMGDDKTHKLGMGSGKSYTTQAAAKQAERNAARNVKPIKVLSLKNGTVKTIAQQTVHKAHGIKFIIKQSRKPNQINANPTLAEMCKLAGVTSISIKILGGRCAKQNQAAGLIEALQKTESAYDVSKRLNRPFAEIIARDNIYVSTRRTK